jgi:hypothetical protein
VQVFDFGNSALFRHRSALDLDSLAEAIAGPVTLGKSCCVIGV